VLLVAVLGVSSAVGTRQANHFSLKGTASQRAHDLLKHDFSAQSGDVHRSSSTHIRGEITDPAIRARISRALAQVARLPHAAESH
jgi:putative drug exporter of the RND superfamily